MSRKSAANGGPKPVKPFFTACAVGALWGALHVPETIAVSPLISLGLETLAVLCVAYGVVLISLALLEFGVRMLMRWVQR
jgi:hypothetical protein